MKNEEWPMLRGEPLFVPEKTDDPNIWVIPSPIELHAHPREPHEPLNKNPSETIATATAAARAGGYQLLCAMPNTGIPTHKLEIVYHQHRIARRSSAIDFACYAGINFRERSFYQLAHMMPHVPGLKLYFGKTTGNEIEYTPDNPQVASTMDHWIKEAETQGFHAPILLHALGTVGFEAMRYIADQGHHAHWCHISTEQEVEYYAQLVEEYGDLVSAEVTPHHLTMTRRNADFQQGWNGARMQPPLGNESDAMALLDAYNDSSLRISLATDHAPHHHERKMNAERTSPLGVIDHRSDPCYGVSGIEFVIPVMTALIKRKLTTKERVVDSLYTQPKRVLGLPDDSMQMKTIVEFGEFVIEEKDFVGKSRNTPYIGWTAGGRVIGYEEEKESIDIIKAQSKGA